MALDLPDIGQANWGQKLNAALQKINTDLANIDTVTDASVERVMGDTASVGFTAVETVAVGAVDVLVSDAVAPINTELDGRLSDSTLSSSFVGMPVAAEQVVYVTPRGSDTKDGRTLANAKKTLASALAALGGSAGRVQLGVGLITTADTHALPTGTEVVGCGRGLTTISYTGAGALFTTATPGVRSYNQVIAELNMSGPGKASTAIAVDVSDMSNVRIVNFYLSLFGTGIRNSSVVLGGAVYQRILDGVINSCGIGVEFAASGSNGARINDTKFGACTTGVKIVDSNENRMSGCQFEVCTTGVSIEATAPGKSDNNSMSECRFESNTTAWSIGSTNVRDTYILAPKPMGTYTYVDNGARTVHLSSGNQAPPMGTKRYRINRGGSYTFLNIDDAVFFNGADAVATLPAASAAGSGRSYTAKNLNATALTVNAAGGNIDGAASDALAQYECATYMSDGLNWYTV